MRRRLLGLRPGLGGTPYHWNALQSCNCSATGALRSLFDWAGTAAAAGPREPRVPFRPAQRRCGGQEWQDEYSWLEAGGAEVRRLLVQERRHAQAWLGRTTALVQQLRAEMAACTPPALVSAPERVGPHEYWVQQLPGRPHPRYLRRALAVAGGAARGAPELVLDVNELAAVYGDYVQVGQMKLSRCGQQVAFTLDAGRGEEAFQAFTRHLATGRLRHLGALGGVVSLEWAADGATLLATQPNELGRPCRVLAYDTTDGRGGSDGSRRGSSGGSSGGGSAPWLLFEEGDERFFVELGRTKDWSFLTINLNSKSASEVHLLPAGLRESNASLRASAPGPALLAAAQPRLVQRRSPGLEYFAEHNSGQLYLLSNARGAANYAVFRVPLASEGGLGQERWMEVVPEVEGVANEDMDMTAGWLVLYQRRQGRQAVAALPLRDGLPPAPTAAAARQQRHGATTSPELQLARLPDWALSVVAGANADFGSSRLRLMLSSPVHPEAAFDWQLDGTALAPAAAAAAAEAADGIDTAAAAAAPTAAAVSLVPAQQGPELGWRQLWATSRDGARVPLTVACAAPGGSATPPPCPRPCLLVVYGAYGHCLPTEFAPERLPLLHRGWVLALAHVRGGGELGRRWHAGGRGTAKGCSADDLEACLDALLAAGYTAPGLVAVEAHSAGGLAAGALLNRRAGALGAALLEAPFVDALSAMCQPELPLTVHEYEEWGDPSAGAAQFEQVRRLCPYQGVHPAPYPPTLLTCSEADLRVPFWGPLKYAARLRAAVAQHSAAPQQGGSGGAGAADSTGAALSQQWRRGGPVLLLPDDGEGGGGHFVHERDLLEARAQRYAFLAAALEGGLQ